MKGRAKLRGKPLEWFCKKASVSKKEYGENDSRCFCYGLIDLQNDEFLEECRRCGAFSMNAKPPEEEQK